MRSFFSVLFLISPGYAFLSFIFPDYFLFWTDKSRRSRSAAFFAGSGIVLLSVAGGKLSPLENFSVRASVENGTETVLDSVRFRGISPSGAEILINNQKIFFMIISFIISSPCFPEKIIFLQSGGREKRLLRKNLLFSENQILRYGRLMMRWNHS